MVGTPTTAREKIKSTIACVPTSNIYIKNINIMLTKTDDLTLDINLDLPKTPTDTHNTDIIHAETSKLKAFFALLKFRLSALVVFSSAIGYALGVDEITDWKRFAIFCFSSFIITGSANTLKIGRAHV